jgi:hypothetical protein
MGEEGFLSRDEWTGEGCSGFKIKQDIGVSGGIGSQKEGSQYQD